MSNKISENIDSQEKLIETLFALLDDQEAVIEQMAKFIHSRQMADEYKKFIVQVQSQSRRRGFHIVERKKGS
ncbi:MAG TPA: hypothetical protein VGE40_09230 [Bacilli bacterium]